MENQVKFPRPYLPDILLGLAKRQSLWLSEEVTQQDSVVVGAVLVERVVARCGRDEVRGDQLGALMDELVERMLAVGSRSSPQDGSGLIVDAASILCHEFAVRFHVALLEVVSEFVEVLVVWQEGVGLRACKVRDK